MINTKIDWKEIVSAAEKLGLEPCVMQAVQTVESGNSGFLSSGRPTILFEGHIFWKQLEGHGIDREKEAKLHPNILYPKWEKGHYSKDREKEYERLEEAISIHEESALSSASWGAFQIMGFNYASCGYKNVHDFVEANKAGAAEQLEAFCNFIKANNLVRHLKEKNWAEFAKRYNGPGYAENKYDTKLAEAYRQCVLSSEKRL